MSNIMVFFSFFLFFVSNVYMVNEDDEEKGKGTFFLVIEWSTYSHCYDKFYIVQGTRIINTYVCMYMTTF